MHSKILFSTVLALISSIVWFLFGDKAAPSGARNGEIVTNPYTLFSDELMNKVDSLQIGYDPRRFSVSILNHLINAETNDASIPLSWEDLVNVNNKTELGLFWMNQYSIKQVVLMKNRLHHHDVEFNKSIKLLSNIESLRTLNDNFFNQEPLELETYDSILLSSDDFKIDLDTQIPLLSPEQQSNLNLEIEEYRYFKEGSLLNISGLAHYDLRFYHSKIQPIDRIAILHRILRAWTRFTTKAFMKTWIAHGSLMGYFFNGLIMPWDDDLDVQMTSESFWKLVRYNQSLIIDYQDDINMGKYLIDINPWFIKRGRNPDNKIDARFIDVESGLYVDITVLTSEVKPANMTSELGEQRLLEFYKVFNPYHDQIVTETEKLQLEFERSRNQTVEANQLISCKDYHFYTVNELSPLIPTIFEGEVVYIPNNIPNLLLREYGRKSLYLLDFNGFHYDKLRTLWTHNEIQYETNFLMNEFLQIYDKIRQTTFKRHIFEKDNLIKCPTFRVEPWIRELDTSN